MFTGGKTILLSFIVSIAAQALALTDVSENYIVNGQTARPGQFPSFVALRSSPTQHVCGGVLINHNWALTSASCVAIHKVTRLQLVTSPNRNERVYPIVRAVAHPQYNKRFRSADVGMVRTSQRIQTNALVSPVSLPSIDLAPGSDRVPLVLAGFGQLKVVSLVEHSLHLKKLNL